MNNQDFLNHYVSLCHQKLMQDSHCLSVLRNHGIFDKHVIESFQLGFADRTILNTIKDNRELKKIATDLGLIQNDKDFYKRHFVIPVFDQSKNIENITFISLHNTNPVFLNHHGLFNGNFITKQDKIIVTDHPFKSIKLIQYNYPNTTFVLENTDMFLSLLDHSKVKEIIMSFDDKSLIKKMVEKGLHVKCIDIDDKQLLIEGKPYLDIIFNQEGQSNSSSSKIIEIEKGFIFEFNPVKYRVIGNFTDQTISLKTSIKAFTNEKVFADSLDLYKHRERQNFIYNILEKFEILDQVLIENNLNEIMNAIEKHKEKKALEKTKQKVDLSEYEKNIGYCFLKQSNLINHIQNDITELGFVGEDKNKILLYLIMTSRLMENPIHGIVISRSSAGKSALVDIMESLCPSEDLEVISDLTAQALYHYGINDLKHKFISISEKQGSRQSEYPLRELISKKSISKSLPMKDPVSGIIRTVNIKVNGPIALVETSSSQNINPENLNRCFVISIDESEKQTAMIHNQQRNQHTLEAFLKNNDNRKIIEKHIYAQRLLRNIKVFNPYAPLLTFPAQRLQTRRDNKKLLKLIDCIAFLHQYRREIKTVKITRCEPVVYIEYTPDDYEIAYNLLSEGILTETLDDLPSPARKLLDQINGYVNKQCHAQKVKAENIIFNRKEIREYTKWSFAQIRNNFRILTDYEYIKLVKSENGTANTYKMATSYDSPDFLNALLSPTELREKLSRIDQNHVVACTG